MRRHSLTSNSGSKYHRGTRRQVHTTQTLVSAQDIRILNGPLGCSLCCFAYIADCTHSAALSVTTLALLARTFNRLAHSLMRRLKFMNVFTLSMCYTEVNAIIVVTNTQTDFLFIQTPATWPLIVTTGNTGVFSGLPAG